MNTEPRPASFLDLPRYKVLRKETYRDRVFRFIHQHLHSSINNIPQNFIIGQLSLRVLVLISLSLMLRFILIHREKIIG